MEKYLMGIDRGTTNVKVAVYNREGKEIKAVTRACEEVQSPEPGFAEQDMNQIWKDTAEAINDIWDVDIRPEKIAGIGLSGQGGGMFLTDQYGNPVRKGIVSLDHRVSEAAKEWEREGAHKKFLGVWNNGAANAPEALLYWLKVYETQNYERIHWIFQCKDWVRFKLTGEAYYETTDASNGFLLDDELKYDLTILDECGLIEMTDKFPELLNPWDLAGTVTEEAAAETGLMQGTPVAAGGHDVAMVAFGSGCYKRDQLTTVLGTFGLNLLLVENPHIMMRKFSKIVLGGSKDCYLMMNGGSTGVITEWFLNTFCQEERKEAAKKGENIFTIIENKVLNAPFEGRSDILCHPFAEPPYTLDGYDNAKFGLFGITFANTKAQIIRAFYEGIAIEMAMSIEVLRKAAKPLDSMKLIGGGAASRLWGQMFADACNIRVEILDVKEVGCRGAALTAGIAVGIYADHSIVGKLSNRVRQVYMPDKEGVQYMRKKEGEFRKIGTILKDTWK